MKIMQKCQCVMCFGILSVLGLIMFASSISAQTAINVPDALFDTPSTANPPYIVAFPTDDGATVGAWVGSGQAVLAGGSEPYNVSPTGLVGTQFATVNLTWPGIFQDTASYDGSSDTNLYWEAGCTYTLTAGIFSRGDAPVAPSDQFQMLFYYREARSGGAGVLERMYIYGSDVNTNSVTDKTLTFTVNPGDPWVGYPIGIWFVETAASSLTNAWGISNVRLTRQPGSPVIQGLVLTNGDASPQLTLVPSNIVAALKFGADANTYTLQGVPFVNVSGIPNNPFFTVTTSSGSGNFAGGVPSLGTGDTNDIALGNICNGFFYEDDGNGGFNYTISGLVPFSTNQIEFISYIGTFGPRTMVITLTNGATIYAQTNYEANGTAINTSFSGVVAGASGSVSGRFQGLTQGAWLNAVVISSPTPRTVISTNQSVVLTNGDAGPQLTLVPSNIVAALKFGADANTYTLQGVPFVNVPGVPDNQFFTVNSQAGGDFFAGVPSLGTGDANDIALGNICNSLFLGNDADGGFNYTISGLVPSSTNQIQFISYIGTNGPGTMVITLTNGATIYVQTNSEVNGTAVITSFSGVVAGASGSVSGRFQGLTQGAWLNAVVISSPSHKTFTVISTNQSVVLTNGDASPQLTLVPSNIVAALKFGADANTYTLQGVPFVNVPGVPDNQFFTVNPRAGGDYATVAPSFGTGDANDIALSNICSQLYWQNDADGGFNYTISGLVPSSTNQIQFISYIGTFGPRTMVITLTNGATVYVQTNSEVNGTAVITSFSGVVAGASGSVSGRFQGLTLGAWINALVISSPGYQPELAIGIEGGQYVIRWPAAALGYNLWTSPVLGAGAVWTLVGTAPVNDPSQPGMLKVTLPPSETAAFYRLESQ